MKYKAVIVDDEELAREKIKRLLNELDQDRIEIRGEAGNGIEAVETIEKIRPDLIFLDVQMPGMNGIEVLRNLQTKPAVIFCTAFDNYAVDAFEVDAVDYLLKPFDADRLSRALERVVTLLANNSSTRIKATMEKLTAQLVRNYRPAEPLSRIATRVGHKIKLLTVDQVQWFSSENSLTFAHVVSEKDVLAKMDIKYTLNELDQRLDPDRFFRVHRSTIVNLEWAVDLIPWFNGKYKVILRNAAKTELIVSRSKARILRELFNW